VRLKSLEIKGFKSFADKTHIILDNPITGIIGPNGCGKSNIVDAIRWVIGEHKIKALRSDNLEDLVFNGSRTRSASGMAEVSLTFENTRNLLPTEFTTVTVTRKFYKNGESEYRLNDVTCRLKDIHNLFLDTGVSNDSYAIIELGMVDDIIKDKDNSRRRMLEQAAGISSYKTRKKEAKQKLEATQQDLDRIEDLLFEIGNNLRTLESQAKKAEKYLVVKNEYKEVSIEQVKASLEHFNEQYKSLNDQLDAETDKKAQLDAVLGSEQAAIEQQKVALIEKEQELSRLQKLYNDLVGRIRQLEGDKKLALQREVHLKEREKNLKELIAGAENQSATLLESISFSGKQQLEETATLETLKKDLEQHRLQMDSKRKDHDDKKRDLERLRSEHLQQQRAQFEAEKKVAVADTTIANLNRSLTQLNDEKQQRLKQITEVNREKSETEIKLAAKQQEWDELQRHQQEMKTRILENQEQLEGLRSQLIEENRKFDARKNEYELLKSLVDSLEGYPESIKFLKKNNEWDNSAPLVSDVFVVQNEYRTALENVLDNYLNYYITPNTTEAAKALSLLDRNKKGKANFFILDRIGKATTPATQQPEGSVSALSVVTVDEQYRPLAKMLLGHVYIADDEAAVTAAHLTDGNVLIHKSGKIVSGEYTIGGGSVGAFEGNKIGRAKNLERLGKEIETLKTSTAALKEQIAAKQSQIAGFNTALNEKNLEQARQEVNRLQNSIINLSNRAENYDQLNTNGDKRSADLQLQAQQILESNEGARTALQQINASLKELTATIQEADAAYKLVEKAFNDAVQLFNSQQLHISRQSSKVEGLKQEAGYRTQQLNDLSNQITQNKDQLTKVYEQIAETEQAKIKGDEELESLLRKKEVDEKDLNEKDRLYYETRNQVAAVEGQMNQKRREKEHADAIVAAIKEKINTMKLQVAGMSERLSIEFKVNLNDILEQERQTERSVEDLTAEAEKLRKRLENMGEINPTAIETFTEMKGRHDFIAAQKADLVSAKASLLSTIDEVETTANARFKETFESVRTNFIEVFKALFTTEDNCDLHLTLPDDPSETGVEIYAQPKGKKPSTLNQLSGGEKALTATAFLFAIYLIKPAPFCILDEVDAPLDDANVGKFTQMIRKFSDNSQFIIVTHNKQTMASVDVIYGVTMQEPGVSKLVPVDFRNYSN